MLPDDGRDEEDFTVAGQQQRSEQQVELRAPSLQTGLPQPEERQHAAAERRQLCGPVTRNRRNMLGIKQFT